LGAALALVRGSHDFGAFGQDSGASGGTRCTLVRTEVVEDGDLVLVRLEADRFLRRMVRRLVGATVRVATGALELREFRDALASGASAPLAPRIAEWTAPAVGLFLERVRYPGDAPADPTRSPAPVISFDARRDGAERGA
jgi:tRNA pseudouridine38-40 synthase